MENGWSWLQRTQNVQPCRGHMDLLRLRNHGIPLSVKAGWSVTPRYFSEQNIAEDAKREKESSFTTPGCARR